MNKIQNEFLGCTSAIVVENNEQLHELVKFLGVNNLFLSDGSPAGCLSLTINGSKRVAFYRDTIGMYVGYCHPADCDNYKIYEFREAFEQEHVEQRSLFGDDTAPGIRIPEDDLVFNGNDEVLMEEDPMDADYEVVKEELSLKDTLNQLTIGTVIPAKCDGNLLELKDKVIEVVKLRENVVVTKENFNDTKEIVTDLNGKAKTMKEQRALFNKEVKKFTEPYSKAFSEVIDAIESVSNKLKGQIKVFEDEEKALLKQKIYETQLNPILNKLVEKDMISEKIKNQFEFKESWLNTSAFTKKGEFTKKVKDDINSEINRLCVLYEQEKKDVENIKSTIQQLSLAHQLDTELNPDTYVALYESGASIVTVNERINKDIIELKAAFEKQAQKLAQEQQIKEQVQTIPKEEKAVEMAETTEQIVDNNGVVVARGNNQKILVEVIDTPDSYKGKRYEYTYTFSGSFGTIKTFSNFLKLLSKLFEDFTYERK